MAFVDEYKSMLRNCLESNNSESACELIKGFHKTGIKPDAECLYLESVYHYYGARYVFALYFADLCYRKDDSFEPVHELIGYLTEYNGDYSDYIPTFTKDVSSYNRHLNILSFKGYLPIVDYTVNHLKTIFETLGHDVFVIDVKEGFDNNTKIPVDASLLGKIDFIYEFNNMGLEFKDSAGNDITVSKGIPIYSYMFDSPLFFAEDFLNYPPNKIPLLADKNHVKYVKRFYRRVRNAFFVPLGSEEKPGDDIPFKDRSIGCIYLGSLKEAPKHLEDAFSDIVFEYQKEHTSLTTEEAIENCYKALTDEQYRRIFPDVASQYPKRRLDDDFLLRLNAHYCFADLKINSYYRKRLVEVLVESGIDVEVYGNGWYDEKLKSNPHFKFGGLISQDECIKKMRDSKFILNSMPWFKDGTHDRIYNAMLAKGLCLTDKSKYLCEEFEDGKDIVFYDLDDMDRLPELVKHYELHPDEAEGIIEKAYDKAVLKHSWANRGIDILELYLDAAESLCKEQSDK